METVPAQSEISFSRSDDDTLLIKVTGDCKIGMKPSLTDDLDKQIDSVSSIKRIIFDTTNLASWDSVFLTFLINLINRCSQHNIDIERKGLPKGVQRLLTLASAVPERKEVRKASEHISFFEQTGETALDFWRSIVDMLNFLGDAFLSFMRLLRGRARFRSSELFVIIQECGAQAFPIVSLISVLVGLIFAFVGAIQLEMFGAQIYVADLVGIAMVRVMGAVMTGIIMAGRTGAAFAAQLGTMQVNEEIDALETTGISPMDFLVLPRMIALILMMPLLCLYSDLMGILGGMIVGVTMLDINFMEYYMETQKAVGLKNLWIGLFHSAVFGVLVAMAGCMRGMQCGRSAASVGKAATSAVVTGIISIVIATAIITFTCQVLGI